MSTRSRIVLISAAGLLLAALPLWAKTTPKAMTAETAVIENTGSTNTSGYKITLLSTGTMVRVVSVSNGGKDHNSKTGNKEPFRTQVRKLFTDLAAAMPLTTMPARHGMRSASFGTATFITYKNQRSPDLTFPGNAQAVALKADIEAITSALHVGNTPRRSGLMRPVTPAQN
jgi:hypothetical protein